MSEKPVESIKTLARYEPDTVYIGTGEYVAECVRADDGDYYLAADVDAAIEALRTEVERLEDESQSRLEACGDAVSKLCAAEARAERLAEALAGLITWIPSADTYRRLGFDPEAPMRALEKARAALGREAGND